ncbi:hypothetical protein [Mesorhizobium sp. L-8-3]|uniref:hypothetical protein n=1 Tax=Mesorhizobium sp. L-8-3 TaxID=2744522 RepID=UPI001928AC7C|nr:hypothetical protein [Mesorhizobium sp. L-8-3]BCH26328.1 hypothetical protein MesoLjLb_61130 [Mesorhizobium sp. L-8-3]
MSGFVERLVARGSGLAGVPGFATLKPRPLSRFETSPEIADGSGGEEVHGAGFVPDRIAPFMAVPATGAIAPEAKPDARPAPPPASAAVGPTGAQTAASRPSIGRVEVEEMRPVRRIQSAAAQTDPGLETVPASEPAPSRPDAAAAPTNRDSVDVALLQPAPASAPNAVEEPAPSPGAPVPMTATRSTQPPPELPSTELPSPAAAIDRRPGRPIGTAEDDPAPPVTVTVGRIDVHFVQPRPAPAPPPQAPRTRGFEAYARVRRGQPRQER